MSTALPPPWQRVFKTPFRELVSEGPTGSLDWRVTLAKANPPEPVAELIGDVVRKSGLWSNEKQAVTGELLAHFGDGLEAAATAEELVESFGDPATAAKLIRRAKKRCRPIGWHAWWWATRGAAIAVVAYVAFGFYLMNRRPQVDTDVLWMTINRPIHSRPEAEKAWPEYARLLEQIEEERDPNPPHAAPLQVGGGLMEGLNEYSLHYSIGGHNEPRRTEEQQAELDDWLTDHADWLVGLRAAALKPSMGLGIGPSDDFPQAARALWGYSNRNNDDDLWHGGLFSSQHPQQNLRIFADWMLADAEYARRQEDGGRVLANVHSAIGLSRQAREPLTLMDWMIADRILRLVIRDATQTLGQAPDLWTAEQLRDLAHALATIERPPGSWLDAQEAGCRDFINRVFAGERLSLRGVQTYGNEIDLPDEVVAMLQAVRSTKRGLADGFSNDPLANLVWRVQAAAVMPWVTSRVTHSEALAGTTKLFEVARRRCATPLWADPPSVEAAMKAMPSSRGEIASLGLWGDGGIDTLTRLDGELDGLLVGIALELARRDADGEWPESLDGLAPRFLPELPIDLINGGPLGYRLVEGQPVVYSLGVDGDDDLGQLPANMNEAFRERLGSDYRRSYYVAPPLREPERSERLAENASANDGDWVLWSLAEPRYVPDSRDQPE